MGKETGINEHIIQWEQVSFERLVTILKPHWPEVDVLFHLYSKDPVKKKWFRIICQSKCISLELDPEDPIIPPPDPSCLGDDGIYIGDVMPNIGKFQYKHNELSTGMLILGAPQAGKTTTMCSILEQLQKNNYGAIICDNRGDMVLRASRFPNAIVIPVYKLKINPSDPPKGVPIKEWHPKLTARWTHDFGLKEASFIYANRKGQEVLEICEKQGRLPTFQDFYHQIRDHKTRPRSSEEGYQERTLARIEYVNQTSNGIFDCQKGMPLVEEAEKGRIVIIDMRRTDRLLADFISAYFLHYLYYKRLYSKNPFDQKIVAVVLDEQRSVVRKRIDETGAVSDIDLLFSRARALSICLCVLEQVPSALGPAILSSSRLRLAFNSNFPEALEVAQLLGLDRRYICELQKLAKGECICRLSGDRIPNPFRMKIPYKSEEAPDFRIIDRMIQKSLNEMESHVVGLEKKLYDVPSPLLANKSTETSNKTHKKQQPNKDSRFPLSPNAFTRFQDIACKPPETINENLERTGCERTNEQRTRVELEKRLGLITYQSAGNKRKIPVLTEQGEDLADWLGLKIRKHKGDPVHDWMVTRTEIKFKNLIEELEDVLEVKFLHKNFGGLFQGRQPDSLACVSMKSWKSTRGKKVNEEEGKENGEEKFWVVSERRIAIQVCSKNNPKYESTVLGDIVSWCDLLAVVVVASTNTKKMSIYKKFMDIMKGKHSVNVLFYTIEDMLDAKIKLAKELGLEK